MASGKTVLNWQRFVLLVCAYAVAYFVASGLDLWTTALALHRPDVGEGNVFATSAGGYNAARAWWITNIASVLMTGLFAAGLWYADRMSPEWLKKPIRSFFYRHFNPLYLDFWSSRTRDRAPLHAVSFAMAFVVLRLFAALNNLLIAAGYSGPMGAAVKAVGDLTTPAIGLILAMGALYTLLALAFAPLGARLIRLPLRNA
jgi:hypothetical protein